MAQLPGRPAQHLTALALAVAVALLQPAHAAALDLEGTWHVLAHYQDANSQSPDQMRWQDRIWVFERKQSRFQWVEYPIVVFTDENGRFERRGSGQYARVLGGWEPSEAQVRDIQNGLKINTRGMKKKTLRGDDASGWSTASRNRPGSASMITYQEHWTVEGDPELPSFVQSDVMGSGRTETMEGATRYDTEEVSADGNVLRGRFDRDGSRIGTFVMRRAGGVGEVKSSSQSDIQARGVSRGAKSSQFARQETRRLLDEGLKESGLELSDEEKDEVVSEILNLVADGLPPDRIAGEVEAMLRKRAEAAGR